MRLWKLIYMDETTNEMDVFRDIEILTDNELKERFKRAIENGQLCEETIEEHKLDASKYYDIHNIADIFAEDGYTIGFVEV